AVGRANVDPELAPLGVLVALRRADDDARDGAVAAEHDDAPVDRGPRRPAGELVDRDQAAVLDVRDDQADLVRVGEQRERPAARLAGEPGERLAAAVALDLGERGRLAADDRHGGVLRAGGCGRTQQLVEQGREGHAREASYARTLKVDCAVSSADLTTRALA